MEAVKGVVGIYRPMKGRLVVHGTYADVRVLLNGMDGLRGFQRHPDRTVWPQCWTVPRHYFANAVRRACVLFDLVRVVDERSMNGRRCDTRCVEATGPDCNCSCWGENHGGLNWLTGMTLVGGTTLVELGTVREERECGKSYTLRERAAA